MTTLKPSGLSEEINIILDSTNERFAAPARREGMNAFRKLGLPSGKSEEYRFTPITRELEKHFAATDFVRKTSSDNSTIERFLIPGLECNVIVFIDGRFSRGLSKVISPSTELMVAPLEESINDSNGQASDYFASLSTTDPDPFGALNGALWESGIFLKVAPNARLEKPIFILHVDGEGAGCVVSHTRHLIVIGEGSEASIIEKFSTCGTQMVFNSSVEEITMHQRATLSYHRIQNENEHLYQVSNTIIHQHAASRLTTFTLTLGGQIIRNNLSILVDGENCESHFNGLYLLNKHTLADNHTVVDHRKANSFSNELYKGIMDDHSKGVFNGKIYVRPHAQKTNAFQSNRNILMSESAAVNTKPQLEIWADDVKCSHGCTSGQLDEEALFYLQSRGISRQTATAMVLNAFAGEVFQTVGDPVLKSYLDNLVSERLQKSF